MTFARWPWRQVTVPEMVVLLQFNTQAQLSLAGLVERTGLPEARLGVA